MAIATNFQQLLWLVLDYTLALLKYWMMVQQVGAWGLNYQFHITVTVLVKLLA